jgi:hypothetical protein
MQYTRRDDQTGAAGEYWRFAAGFDREAEKQFVTLSELAGVLLTEVLEGKPDAEGIISRQI